MAAASILGHRRSHVVISAPSQWGQQGCAHLLHRAIAHGGKVTLIVPRRHQRLFETASPKMAEWKDFSSLKDCLEKLKASGRPVDFIYDDHLNHLAVELISQRRSKSHLIVGYVTSSAEDHLAHADYLSRFCDRVLVEKPVSRIYFEIRPGAPFTSLVEEARGRGCTLKTAEHYLFRPGVSQVWWLDLPAQHAPPDSLNGFLARHRHCDLQYEFHFAEEAGRDDPSQRLGAYQDGSILDVLAPHGLGPVARLLLPILGVQDTEIDFYRQVSFHSVRTWQASDAGKEVLKVPVLAETAAELIGDLDLPGRNQTLRLILRSAKGCRRFLRYFKLSCPIDTCRYLRQADREELQRESRESGGAGGERALFCGVSLGAAGSTILDYFPGEGKFFWERDGGYMSDTRGGNSEAANAQAAMLDALLLDREFESANGRFVPVASACELVRLGLKAQGVSFHNPRGLYPWGEGPPAWDHAQSQLAVRLNSHPDTQSSMPPGARLEDFKPGLAQVAEILGIQPQGLEAQPYHRVVTVLGPEGAGNTDIALVLYDQLKSCCPVSFLDVPRDEDWDRPREATREPALQPSRFTLDMVLRQLTSALGLSLTVAQRSSEVLPGYLRRLPGGGVILLNGVDRLPDESWQVLVRILNELPARYRILLVTKHVDRAAGFVVRTRDLLDTPEFQHLRERRLGHYFRLFTRSLGRTPAGSEAERYYTLLRSDLRLFAQGNLTVEQQIASYVMYIALPATLRKIGLACGGTDWWRLDLAGIDWGKLRQLLKQEVESLDLPSPLVAHPEALLDRISKLCLAMISEEERAAIRSLAAISGDLPSRIINEAQPGLFWKVRHFQPVRALFDRVERGSALLFPRVRRAVLNCEERELAEIRSEIERRRLILSLRGLGQRIPQDDPIRVQQHHETQIRLFYGTSLGHLNLDGSPFEDCCTELIETLETSSDLHGDPAAGSLVELLTEESSWRRTNLGLLTRARLTRLKGWLLRSSAGVDPARLNQALEVVWTAYHLADFCAVRTGATRSDEQLRQENEALVLTMQGVAFAGLAHSRCWHRLFGLKTPPWPSDQTWERFVRPPADGEAAAERNLWSLCRVRPDAELLEPLCDQADKVRALGLRTLALYLVSRPETAANPQWRRRAVRLCLWAAKLNHRVQSQDCRARNLMEAAFLLADDLNGRLDLEGRTMTPEDLIDEAHETFDDPVRKLHPGLVPYLELLTLMTRRRLGKPTPPLGEELKRLEDEFELTGDTYFVYLMRDMKKTLIPSEGTRD